MKRSQALIAALAVAGLLSGSAALSRSKGKAPTAVELTTDAGTIVIAIRSRQAPASSAAFLAQVRGKRYDGGSFFRTVRPDTERTQPPIQVVQAGVTDSGAPVAEGPIPHEDTARTGLRHIDGAVSLPRGPIGTTSATSFFISVGAHPALDFGGKRNADGQGFAVFGQVICGMDVVRKIHGLPVGGASPAPQMEGQMLAPPVVIRQARITAPRCPSGR